MNDRNGEPSAFAKAFSKAGDSVKGAMASILYGDFQGAGRNFQEMAKNLLADTAKTFTDKVLLPIKDAVFGNKDEHGFSRGGILSGITNSFKDASLSIKSLFTGQGWIDSSGKTHDAPEESVAGKIKEIGANIKEGIMTKLFGNLDETTGKRTQDGIVGKIKSTISEGIQGWKESWFGKNVSDEEAKKSISDSMKKYLPNAGAGAAVGAVGGISAGGILGTLVGGPIGGAAIGTAAGLLSKSENFQNWLFGEMGEDGERAGGFISKNTQDYLKKNKYVMLGGASVGTITGALTGGGLLGTLVGGPIAGAAMGVASSLFLKSDTMHESCLVIKQPDKKVYSRE